MFLDARLPRRDVVAQAWARQSETALWSGIEIDPDHRRQLGSAIEIRIGLDVAAAPGYWDVLSFLPPEECQALLSAAGYSADGKEDLADAGTTTRCCWTGGRVSHPVARSDDQQAVLTGCWDAAGMRDVAHGTDAAVQLRRSLLAHIREHMHRAGPLQGPVMTALVHLWDGYQHHGRRRMMALGDRVIIEPELASGFGQANLVIGRCLVDVKAVLSLLTASAPGPTPTRRASGSAPRRRTPPRSVPVTADQRPGLLPLPRPRGHRILPVLGRDPPVEREPGRPGTRPCGGQPPDGTPLTAPPIPPARRRWLMLRPSHSPPGSEERFPFQDCAVHAACPLISRNTKTSGIT